MVTVAHLVKKIISDRPILQESMREGILSFAALAERIAPQIERELGKKAGIPAIVMAIRRYGEELSRRKENKAVPLFGSDIVMRTGLVDVGVVKSSSLGSKLERLYSVVNFSRGDILNLVHGNYEVSIVTNERHMQEVLGILGHEKIIAKEKGLVAISLSLSQRHLYAPGTIFSAVRKLAWDNVNIFEIVSTATELVFIVGEKDSVRAYNSLSELVRRS